MTQPRPLLGVSACLFREDRVLLVQRARPPFNGLYSLPGGRVEFGERLEAAASRELREETGLDLGPLVFHHLHEAIDVTLGVHAVIAVFRSEVDVIGDPSPGDDAVAAFFVDMQELESLAAERRTTEGLLDVVRSARR